MMFRGIEICCPHCKGDLHQSKGPEKLLRCQACNRVFPVILNIPDLRVFPDPYIDEKGDRTKGLQLAARIEELSFAQLVDFYYSITSVVPPRHASQYKSGLMAAVGRAEAALISWEIAANRSDHVHPGSVLDVGCGTAPFLVAAASRSSKLVGVDIAFRWLVVAKKRLAEANLDIPLICACAEALPFPEGSFDRVVIDSVLEHFQDQPRALAECYRVTKKDGYLNVATPNRLSLGPDPHMGLWAGGYLPDQWLAAYVRWQGGIPPKRRLVSARSLTQLLQRTAFSAPRVYLPNVSVAQRNQFGMGLRCLVDIYQFGRRLPISRQILRWVCPVLHAVAWKLTDARERAV